MYSTTIQDRFFGLIYRSPKRSNIDRGVMIRIHTVSAVIALKRFAVSIAYVVANAARFGGICRIDRNNRNANTLCPVSNKGTKLLERPLTHSFAKFFTFIGRPKTYAGQVLEGYAIASDSSNRNDFFCDCVIYNGSRSSFAPGKPFQEFFSSLRAFALNRTAYLLFLFSIIVEFFGVKRFPRAYRTYVNKAKIATDKFLNILNIIFRNLAGLKQVKFAFLKDKIGLSFNVGDVCGVVTNVMNLKPSPDRPYRSNIAFVTENPAVIRNAAQRLKGSFCFPVQFVSIADFRYATHNDLCRKIESTLNRVVAFRVNLELVKYPLAKSSVRNSITGCIGFFNSSQKRISLILVWQKLYLQGQFHLANIQTCFIYLKIFKTNGRFLSYKWDIAESEDSYTTDELYTLFIEQNKSNT